jgi:transcriptional regulator with XRE-family HTH domain
MHVGNRIKQLIEMKRIEQKNLAELSGFSQSRISELVKSESCQTSTLEKVCKGLGITLSDFFSGDFPVEQRSVLLDIVKEIGLEYLIIVKNMKEENISAEQFSSALNDLKSLGYFSK